MEAEAFAQLFDAYNRIRIAKGNFDVGVRQLEIFKREMMQPEASEPCSAMHSALKSALEDGDGERHRQEIGRMLGNLTGLQALYRPISGACGRDALCKKAFKSVNKKPYMSLDPKMKMSLEAMVGEPVAVAEA